MHTRSAYIFNHSRYALNKKKINVQQQNIYVIVYLLNPDWGTVTVTYR